MSKLIGAHLSVSKGLHSIQPQMNDLNTTTCALFLRNPRGFNSKPLTHADIKKWNMHVTHPEILLPHGPYIINLANKDNFAKHHACLEDDLLKCSQLGIKMYNIHPGSDVNNIGKKEALSLISKGINELENKDVTVVLENTAGDGKKVGYIFEDLRDIIENVYYKERVGVCLDTCHLFGAGYDIRTEDSFREVMENFKQIVGMRYLKGLHLNDSKECLGSRKDRHECLGKGKIGLDAFKFIMKNDLFNEMPLILETPLPSEYKKELEMLRMFEDDVEA